MRSTANGHGAAAGRVAAALGKGLVAGLAGTAVLTALQKLEMTQTGKEGSDTPAEAVEKVLGIRFADDASRKRASKLTHWTYGTALGGVRGLLGAAGLGNVSGTAVHFGVVWGGEAAGLPALDLAPPPTDWGPEQVAKDAGYHGVYALAVGAVYAWLDGGSRHA